MFLLKTLPFADYHTNHGIMTNLAKKKNHLDFIS